MDEECYLSTPLAFVWAMMGMVGENASGVTGLRAAGGGGGGGGGGGTGTAGAWRDPEVWRRRCFQSLKAYGPGGGGTAVGVLQRVLRAALSRRALARRRACGLVCCTAKRAVAGVRYGRVLASILLQALLRRYRCCAGGIGGLAGGAGAGEECDEVLGFTKLVGDVTPSSAAALGLRPEALAVEASYMVDVSSSSASSSANVTPCMTPTTPAGYVNFKHLGSAKHFNPGPGSSKQEASSSLKPHRGARDAGGGVGRFVAADDCCIDHEYSSEYEKESDDEYQEDYEDDCESASADDADGSGAGEREERVPGEAWQVRETHHTHTHQTHAHQEKTVFAGRGQRGGGDDVATGRGGGGERRMVWVAEARVSQGFFYVDNATFSCSFSLVKWRSAVAHVAPRVRMAAARAKFRQMRGAAQQLAAVVRRMRAAAALCAKCRAATLLLRHMCAHEQRHRYVCDRSRASAARMLAALVLRRGQRAAYIPIGATAKKERTTKKTYQKHCGSAMGEPVLKSYIFIILTIKSHYVEDF
jgi:hypothetical protein